MTLTEAKAHLREVRAMAMEARSTQIVSNSYLTILVEPQLDANGDAVRVIYRINGKQQTPGAAAIAMVKHSVEPRGAGA